MRSDQEYLEVMRLLELGWPDNLVARSTGIPRSTVRDWRRAKLGGSSGRSPYAATTRSQCPRCHDRNLDGPAYVYLLGLYLGDGCLSRQSERSWKLRIVQDAKYPRLIAECGAAMSKVRETESVSIQSRGSYVEINASWRHWLCLFPQHGSGPKNQREIALEDWQAKLVLDRPEELVRGLIHSDGSRYVNTVTMTVSGQPKVYRYCCYSFTNTSRDILDILGSALDILEVHHRRYDRIIAISRRDAVATLDGFVGPKS
jgi:hypothetical protein